MKKTIIILSYLLSVSIISCDDKDSLEKSQIESGYTGQILYLEEMYSNSYKIVKGDFNSFVNKSKNGVVNIDISGLITNSMNSLKGKYIPKKFDPRSIYHSKLNGNQYRTKDNAVATDTTIYFTDYLIYPATIDINASEVFDEEQKQLLAPLIETMLSMEVYSTFDLVVNNFNEQVASSDLTDEKKLQLFAFSTGLKATKDFAENGGVDLINEALSQSINNDITTTNGRVLGCKVDTRQVMLGAAYGALTGAAYGGYVGATAGTFTVPVLGTAVGGVGGAVFGGAAGFISGAFGSVVTELLSSCFRQEQSQCASLEYSLELAQEQKNKNQIMYVMNKMAEVGCVNSSTSLSPVLR